MIAFLVVHSLAVLGLLGYGLISGRINDELLDQYLATWKGEKLVPPPADVVEDVVDDTPQDAAAKIISDQQEKEILTREMQMFHQQLVNKEAALQAAQAKLNKDLADLKLLQKQFDKKIAEHNQKAQADGFKKALKNYSSMNPKYVKDDFMQMTDEDAVRFLSEMKSNTATAILEKFRTPEEMLKRQKLIQMMEKYGQVAVGKQLGKISGN